MGRLERPGNKRRSRIEYIKVGSLVSHNDFHGVLVGVVLRIDKDYGRAAVFWQKYGEVKLVEFKELRVLSN